MFFPMKHVIFPLNMSDEAAVNDESAGVVGPEVAPMNSLITVHTNIEQII